MAIRDAASSVWPRYRGAKIDPDMPIEAYCRCQTAGLEVLDPSLFHAFGRPMKMFPVTLGLPGCLPRAAQDERAGSSGRKMDETSFQGPLSLNEGAVRVAPSTAVGSGRWFTESSGPERVTAG